MASRSSASDLGERERTTWGGCPFGLLDFDFRALLLERGLDLLGLVASNTLLDGLGCRVDEVLGLLEAELSQLADDLDDRNLVRPDLGEDRAELGLLLGRRRSRSTVAAACRRSGRSRHGRRRGDAVALLEALDELGQLEDGHL